MARNKQPDVIIAAFLHSVGQWSRTNEDGNRKERREKTRWNSNRCVVDQRGRKVEPIVRNWLANGKLWLINELVNWLVMSGRVVRLSLPFWKDEAKQQPLHSFARFRFRAVPGEEGGGQFQGNFRANFEVNVVVDFRANWKEYSSGECPTGHKSSSSLVTRLNWNMGNICHQSMNKLAITIPKY